MSIKQRKMDSFFEWTEISQIDEELYEFEHCTLTRKVGPWPLGTRVAKIVLNFEEAEVSFLDEVEDEFWTGMMKIRAGGDELKFTSSKRPEEVNILIYNYSNPVLQAPLDVFQKNRALKNIMIDYAHGDGEVEVETLDGRFLHYPLKIEVACAF